MTLQDLTDKINEYYGIDLKERTRSREYAYARKLYSALGRAGQHTLEKIGEQIGLNHASVLYHSNSTHSLTRKDKEIFKRIAKDFSLPVETINLVKKKMPKRSQELLNKHKMMRQIRDVVDGWDNESIRNFISTRLELYDKMIKSKTH